MSVFLKTSAILFFAIIFIPVSNAKSGCCSWHGGVDYCGASGYYICNDGTRSPSCTCGNSYYTPIYTTPSCPIFSSYSYSSGKCECNYGYVSNGSSCISENQACKNQYGYNSRSTFSGKCECSYGYQFNHRGTKCISNDDYCKEIDWAAEYDILKDSCVCKKGYKVGASGNSCVRDYGTTNYTPLYFVPQTRSSSSRSSRSSSTSSLDRETYCGPNSFYSPLSGCHCDSGYTMQHGSCVKYNAPKLPKSPTLCVTKNPCTCVDGYAPIGNRACRKISSRSSSSSSITRSSSSKATGTARVVNCQSSGRTSTCLCPSGYMASRSGKSCIRR